VGIHTAQALHQMGCRIVAVSDSTGGVYRPEGLDLEELVRYKGTGARFSDHPQEDRRVTNAELLGLPCDVLVPAALEAQVTQENAGRIQARLIVEGANGPTTPEADAVLNQRGIVVVPDILANAGGVVVSYFEWVQDLQYHFWGLVEVKQKLEQILGQAFAEVTATARQVKADLRTAALMLAVRRVMEAMKLRGLYP
jgi:glutamate dehydrogenase (NAD(P)+)